MPDIKDYLKRTDRLVWSRFLSSEEGRQGLAFLRMACPRPAAKSDADLIRNSVGFDYWMKCVDGIIQLGDVPTKAEKIEDDEPLEQ